MKFFSLRAFLTVSIGLTSNLAFASTAYWADWQSSPDSQTVSGQIITGTDTIDVTFSSTSPTNFVQLGSGTNYWTGSAYTNGVIDNAPPPSELIALGEGGTITINFSKAILNPYVALNSWNGNTAEFGQPITVLSNGLGYWGSGTPQINLAGTGFFGSGEVHGIIQLTGTFSSFSFTHTNEYWHGITIGTAGPAPVPLPAASWLFGSGILGVLGLKRRLKYV